jgi:hypothetical protein
VTWLAEAYVTGTNGLPINQLGLAVYPLGSGLSGSVPVTIIGTDPILVQVTASVGQSVAVNNFPAVQQVTGSVLTASGSFVELLLGGQPLSTNNPLPISGTEVNVSIKGGVQVFVSASVPLSVSQATSSIPWIISGSTDITNFPAVQQVTGTVGLSAADIFPPEMVGSFGVLLANSEVPIVNIAFPYGIPFEQVQASGVFGGTVGWANGIASVQAGTGSKGAASFETNDACRYIAGQGVRMKFAGMFAQPVVNSMQEMGIGEDIDGFFFGASGSNFGILRRQNGKEFWTFTSSFSYDKLDGTGPSGMQIDVTKGNVYEIDYQWLGFGAVNFLVENPDNGKFIPVHQIKYANANVIPSIANPILPLRMAVKNFGNTTNVSVSASSMGVFTEGAEPLEHGNRRSFSNNKINVLTEISIFALQNGDQFNGRRNRLRTKIDFFGGSNRQNNTNVECRLILNPTLGTSSFTPIAPGLSPMSVDIAGSTFTGGRELFNFQLGPAGTQNFDLSGYELRMDPDDILVVAGSGSANSGISVSLAWVEEL